MPHRDMIVVGASRGGIDACRRLLAMLPADMEAALLLVQHLSPASPGNLPSILQASSAWPVQAARDGEVPLARHVYVAIPDHHLLLEGDRLRLSRGPRECRSRPAVDVLFRSAAYYRGERVIGIVLTGMLDDGTAGLWAIKDRGGVGIVQDPAEAEAPSMPESALRHVTVDHILRLSEIPAQLSKLTGEPLEREEVPRMSEDKMRTEVGIALESNALARGALSLGDPSHYTCPECHGSMVRIKDGPIERFRCHTGHAYSEQALVEGGAVQAEKALWSALAQLEEHYLLLKELAQRNVGERSEAADQYLQKAAHIARMISGTRELALSPALQVTRGVND